MSDETPSSKKTARKGTRKKSAAKKTASKSTEESPSEKLPLDEPAANTELEKKASKKAPRKKSREPRGGVRDARSEAAKSDDAAGEEQSESVEKLVPEDASNSEKQERPKDEDHGEQRERRGRNRGRGRGNNREREVKTRPPVDEDHLRKKAWKIYESEVTEEGLALLDDSGLRDYARASFNAARIFLEEQGRILEKEFLKKEKEKDQD